MIHLIISFLILITAALAFLPSVLDRQRRIVIAYGPLGYASYVMLYGFWVILPMGWVFFVASGSFGPDGLRWIQYEQNFIGRPIHLYPWVALLYVSLFCVSVSGVLIKRSRTRGFPGKVTPLYPLIREIVNGLDARLGKYVIIVSWIITLLNILVLIFFIGVDRLWMSDFDRFEGFRVQAGGVAFIRVTLLLATVVGMTAAVLLISRKYTFQKLCIVFLSSLGHVLFESRMLAIVCAAVAIALIIKYSRKRTNWFLVALSAYVVYLSLKWPLSTRAVEGTGLLHALMVLKPSFFMITWDNFEFLLNTTTFGFGLTAEGLNAYLGGSFSQELPFGYILLSYSPLPSFIDGFYRYQSYFLKFLPWVPYNAITHYIDFFPPLVFSISVFNMIFFSILKWAKTKRYYLIVGAIVAVCMFLMTVYVQQYHPRQIARFFWVAVTMTFAVKIFFDFFIPNRNPSSR